MSWKSIETYYTSQKIILDTPLAFLLPKSPNMNKIVAGLKTHLFNTIQCVEVAVNIHVIARVAKDYGVIVKSSSVLEENCCMARYL